MLILNIATQPIKIDYNMQKASVQYHTISPTIQIDTQAAKLEITQPKGELEIDTTPCRYAYGIKNMQDSGRDNAQEAKNTAIEAVGRITEEGNRMARIESRENAIVEMSVESMMAPVRELSFNYITRPDINYKPNKPQINFIDGKLDIDFQRGKVQVDFEPGKFNLNVTQYPSVKMWTSENKIDMLR